jgi:hypothetical protein
MLEHRDERGARDDDVIEERRGYDVGGVGDALGELDVFSARGRVAAGVVVDEDERARPFAKRDAERVARGDEDAMEPPRGHAPRRTKAVAAVERENP